MESWSADREDEKEVQCFEGKNWEVLGGHSPPVPPYIIRYFPGRGLKPLAWKTCSFTMHVSKFADSTFEPRFAVRSSDGKVAWRLQFKTWIA